MYQEKSECEKSIIKTLQSQQKQFTEDQRRRAERNENILRQLDRIDYQASALAAKTERLKALKKQYEKYLLSLWNRRRHGRHSTNENFAPPSQFSTSFAPQSFIHQSQFQSRDVSEFNYPAYAPHNALPSNVIHTSTPHNYHRNQSNFGAMPPYLPENSIRASNYRTTGAINEPQFSHPPTHHVTYSDLAQNPQSLQLAEKKSFHHNDSSINSNDIILPTTINSIYNQQQHHNAPQFPPFAEKLSTRPYQPIYQPLETHNYRSENSKLSETFNRAPLFTSSDSTQSVRGAFSSNPSEALLKNHLEKVSTNAYISDGDEETESDGEKQKATRRSIRRSDSISDGTFQPLKPKSEALFTQHDDSIDNSHFKQLNEPNIKHPQEVDTALSVTRQSTAPMNDLAPSENMHQVWEKIVDPIDGQLPSTFVIPKIVVDTQIDLTDTAPTIAQLMEGNQGNIHEKGDSPERTLNHETKRRSSDNQRNESLSLASTESNISPLTEAGSSIYHYDKQPFSDEQQKHQQQSRVEQELSSFGEIKISEEGAAATQAVVSYESKIKTNNSLAEGNSDDGGVEKECSKEAINNINDDKTLGSSTTLALNDKINEIYRKIEKIEDKYYDEKGKIIESFERRMSTSSNDEAAKTETKLTGESANDFAEFDSERLPDKNSQQENMNYGNDSQADQHQSEIAVNWSEPEAQETAMQPNYNYSEPETQQNSEQPYVETIEPSVDYSYEPQQLPQFDYQYDAGVIQTNPNDDPYEPQQQYQDFVDPYQQQSESVYSHPDDNTQQQQEANNYNPTYALQSDSNYQQNNYDGTQENPSNYTNDSAELYYDYDQNQQLQQESETASATAPQMMYDDQNYSHQPPATYDGEALSQYSYENVDNKANVNQEHSNENNYGYTENLNETSGDDGTRYIANEYQTDANNLYAAVDGGNMYEPQTANEMTLENANYETQQFEQESNDIVEQPNENYGGVESFLSTTTSESSEIMKPMETEGGMNASFEESTPLQPSKRDDVRLVKQLLDSESDDTSTSRSNLLKTSIMEENESDFDFSAS